MSLEVEIYQALSPLFPGGSEGPRVYPGTFPQDPVVPLLPAARFVFISVAPVDDICGNDDETADVRTQVDIYSRTFDTARALRKQVITAMNALPTPTRFAGGFETPEPALKAYRCSVDFLTTPSS